MLIYIGMLALVQWFAIYVILQPLVWFGASALVCLTLSFTIGFDVATRYRNWNIFPYIVKTEDAEFLAKVVRSGERGLLFHDETSKQLMLLPWSEIKRVRTARPPVT
jgi:hypothetical protein